MEATVNSFLRNFSPKALKITLVVIAAIIAIPSYISNANYGNEAEKQIIAEYKRLKTILSAGSLKIADMVQIPKMKTRDLEIISEAAIQGRYGPNGSQAVFQWIQENYPGQVTDDLYIQITQAIEAFRDEYKVAQEKFIDMVKAYETNLGYIWKGFWLKMAGYPKINLDDYQIIISGYAQDAFEAGIDNGLNLLDD